MLNRKDKWPLRHSYYRVELTTGHPGPNNRTERITAPPFSPRAYELPSKFNHWPPRKPGEASPTTVRTHNFGGCYGTADHMCVWLTHPRMAVEESPPATEADAQAQWSSVGVLVVSLGGLMLQDSLARGRFKVPARRFLERPTHPKDSEHATHKAHMDTPDLGDPIRSSFARLQVCAEFLLPRAGYRAPSNHIHPILLVLLPPLSPPILPLAPPAPVRARWGSSTSHSLICCRVASARWQTVGGLAWRWSCPSRQTWSACRTLHEIRWIGLDKGK